MSDYTHVVWAEELIGKLNAEQDRGKKAELVLRARSRFSEFQPAEKADIFIYLIGRLEGDG